MQAPLRKGRREETLGRAKGVKRTGRSLLFGLLLLGLCVGSSLSYTWERLTVESMLRENFMLEKNLELIQQKSAKLSYEVAGLEGLGRIRLVATTRLGMAAIDWEDVLVIGQMGAESR